MTILLCFIFFVLGATTMFFATNKNLFKSNPMKKPIILRKGEVIHLVQNLLVLILKLVKLKGHRQNQRLLYCHLLRQNQLLILISVRSKV